MRCLQCDSDTPADGWFCAACGVRHEVSCALCGHDLAPAAAFCSWCGVAVAPPSGRRQAANGERKQATILFADIVDSTHLIAGLDAEAAMGRLHPVLIAMSQAVRRFNGIIIRNLGDGLKASFGAPRALEGHALLACKAALAMQEAVAALPNAPMIRIGLHSGEVVAGELDTGSAIEPETVGLTVHLASRIEQLAEPGGICLSQACRQLVHAYCDTIPLGLHPVKGFVGLIEIHGLIALQPTLASERFQNAGLTPFLGRAEELAMLRRGLNAAEQGDTAVIGIAAAPGIGKSRLCYEFTEGCRRRGIDVLEARASIYAHATPMQPVLEMLRSFLRLSPLEKPAPARERVANRLRALDPSFEPDLPLLSDFLGIGAPEQPAARLDPRLWHARLRDIVRRMVKAVGRRPSVVLIEDLHWIDPASAEFVETLVDAVQGTRILLVLNFRPSYRAAWMDRPYYRELALAELDRSDIHGLVRDLLGEAPGLSAISAQIADRSGGNPFFAEELVTSLAEGGTLCGARGFYRAAAAADAASLPPTLEAVLGARIDRLPDAEKNLLQIGAIIGKEFPLEILRHVAGLPPKRIDAMLDRLTDAELVHRYTNVSYTNAAGRGFAFRHPLIQEVAYTMQLRARRTELHAAVAKAIEQFEWGRLDEFAGLLAHHFEAAGQMLDAAKHLFRSASWVGQTSTAEAFKQWKKTRRLLEGQPRSPADNKIRAIASGYVLNFGWSEGMTADEAKPYADEALRYAREVGDKVQGPQLLAGYGRILVATGSADDYVALINEALALSSREAGGRTAILQGSLTQAHSLAGYLLRSEAANDAALATVAEQRRLGDNAVMGLDAAPFTGFDIEHWIKCQRARLLLWLGRIDEAESWLADVLKAEGTRSEAAVVQYIPHFALIELACSRNDPQTAHRHAGRILAYAEQSGVPYMRVQALGATALAKIASDDFTGAEQDLRDAIAFARRVNAGLEFEPRLLTELAYAQYRAGQYRDAADTARNTIAVAVRRAHRLVECHASMIRAAALARSDGARVRGEATTLLRRSDNLLSLSGAAFLAPLFNRIRTEVETTTQ